MTPTVDVPSPWLTRDIGAVGLAGGASFTNGKFTVTGSGADIGGTADEFRFAHLSATGDCTIIARVASLESHINSWSKAGVMIRESLDANAANAFIAVTPGNGVAWQYRSSTGGSTTINNTTGLSAPYWVKLVRSGNTFTGYYSSDGTNWTQLGSTTLTMASTAYIGLAITSHNDYTLCSATFDNVTAPGWAHPPASTPSCLGCNAGRRAGVVELGGLQQRPELQRKTGYQQRRSLHDRCHCYHDELHRHPAGRRHKLLLRSLGGE